MHIVRSVNIIIDKNLHNQITYKNFNDQLFIKKSTSTLIYHQYIGISYIYSWQFGTGFNVSLFVQIYIFINFEPQIQRSSHYAVECNK
jgi:hypothetical protein